MVASARTLADISDERIVPVDYLAVLLVLFFFIVLDRLVYTLGLHLGKVCLPLALPELDRYLCCARRSLVILCRLPGIRE